MTSSCIEYCHVNIWSFFYRAKAKAGDRVLVHGASGAVGLAACQMAKAHGKYQFKLNSIRLIDTI